jgi:hypothetical protein
MAVARVLRRAVRRVRHLSRMGPNRFERKYYLLRKSPFFQRLEIAGQILFKARRAMTGRLRLALVAPLITTASKAAISAGVSGTCSTSVLACPSVDTMGRPSFASDFGLVILPPWHARDDFAIIIDYAARTWEELGHGKL